MIYKDFKRYEKLNKIKIKVYSIMKNLEKVKNNPKHKYYTDLSQQKESDCLDCKTKKDMNHLRTKKVFKKTEESLLKKNVKKTQHKDIFKSG